MTYTDAVASKNWDYLKVVQTSMNVQPTPPTPTATAQTTRRPAPTLWAAGAAPATQVSEESHYTGVTGDM